MIVRVQKVYAKHEIRCVETHMSETSDDKCPLCIKQWHSITDSPGDAIWMSHDGVGRRNLMAVHSLYGPRPTDLMLAHLQRLRSEVED